MRILAIETTDLTGSVAVADCGRVIAVKLLEEHLRSAQSLAPAIVDLLAVAGWQPADVQLLAVATGPGSFTGLRVGVTTAKMFAYAVGAEILGVNTLEAIAWQVSQSGGVPAELWTVMDAQREQVFAGHFVRTEADNYTWSAGTLLIDNTMWLAQLSPGQGVSGPALVKLADRLPKIIHVVSPSAWTPRADAVCQLAWRDFQAGRRDDVFALLPQYFRASAAEEKRARSAH